MKPELKQAVEFIHHWIECQPFNKLPKKQIGIIIAAIEAAEADLRRRDAETLRWAACDEDEIRAWLLATADAIESGTLTVPHGKEQHD